MKKGWENYGGGVEKMFENNFAVDLLDGFGFFRCFISCFMGDKFKTFEGVGRVFMTERGNWESVYDRGKLESENAQSRIELKLAKRYFL
jgi:hypothetical protein